MEWSEQPDLNDTQGGVFHGTETETDTRSQSTVTKMCVSITLT